MVLLFSDKLRESIKVLVLMDSAGRCQKLFLDVVLANGEIAYQEMDIIGYPTTKLDRAGTMLDDMERTRIAIAAGRAPLGSVSI